jgi:hypothetical protein
MAINAAVSSPADVVNLALRRIGYKLRVGWLYEGSLAAKQALDVYAQTRDEILRQDDWGFAERNVIPTLLKIAPPNYIPPVVWNPATNPPLPYLFEYAYPNDCLKVRALKPTPMFVPNFDPQPNVFSIANDNTFVPAQKVILCMVPQAVLVYTGQVTDPTTWEADFVEAFAAALGRRLAPTLANMDAAKLEAADEGQSAAIAEMTQG